MGPPTRHTGIPTRHEARPRPHRTGLSRRLVIMACVLACAALPCAPPLAQAQYTFDPAAPDEQGDFIRYFGSVRDDAGAAVQNATLLITHKSASFVFVTDNLGRFRAHLPTDALASKVSIQCFKADYSTVRISKRPGPRGAKPSVQVDCVLKGQAPRAG